MRGEKKVLNVNSALPTRGDKKIIIDHDASLINFTILYAIIYLPVDFSSHLL